jgi:addiction module HigA family antidote
MVPSDMKNLANIHLGEILQEEFLIPMGISVYKLSKSIGVQQTRISKIIKGERGITADKSMRFSKYFGTTPEFWMNLQREHDLRKVKSEIKEIIDNIVPISV